MTAVIGTGHFVSWDGGCMFISGRGNVPTGLHAHYSIQIAFGSEHGLRFRPTDRDDWTAYDGVVIASRQPHTMDSSGVAGCAVIFVDPETREGHALSERYAAAGITPIPGDAFAASKAGLFAAWRAGSGIEAVAAGAQRVVRELTGGVMPSVVTDERILRATAYIRSHIEGSLSLEEVAEVACLSPSRFRHLFVEETGMALRPYILWRRFVHVWELLMGGASLSTAAHAAGFADAAHLTRTSRRAFGFPPSALQLMPRLEASAQPSLPAAGQPLHTRR